MAFFDTDLDFEGDLQTISGVLQSFGISLTEDLRESIAARVGSDTNLAQSVRFDVTNEAGGYRFRLYFPKYGTYLDEGVSGKGGYNKKQKRSWRNKGSGSRFSFNQKKPALNPKGSDVSNNLEGWARSKGINKWAVQEAIYRQGIKKTEWFSAVVDENLINDLVKKLETAGAKQMELDFVKIIENGNND